MRTGAAGPSGPTAGWKASAPKAGALGLQPPSPPSLQPQHSSPSRPDLLDGGLAKGSPLPSHLSLGQSFQLLRQLLHVSLHYRLLDLRGRPETPRRLNSDVPRYPQPLNSQMCPASTKSIHFHPPPHLSSIISEKVSCSIG